MFRMIHSSIIRGTLKLQLHHLALFEPYLLPSVDVEESSTSVDGSKYGSTSARGCNYSLGVLLVMDVGIIRNM